MGKDKYELGWVNMNLSVRPEAREEMRALAKHYNMTLRQLIDKLVADEKGRIRKREAYGAGK